MHLGQKYMRTKLQGCIYSWLMCQSVKVNVCAYCLQSLFQQNKTKVSFREMGRLTARNSLAPLYGALGQIPLSFNKKLNFKDYYTKLYVCSYKIKTKNVSNEIFILMPGSCPRLGPGRWGARGTKKIRT